MTGGSDRIDEREQAILAVVTELLETEGYEAVQVRRIAAVASVSLTTIYRRFGTLEALIVRAVRDWMEAHARVSLPVPDPARSPQENVHCIAEQMIEPWRRHPNLARAFVRAGLGPGGAELRSVATGCLLPPRRDGLDDYDPAFIADLRMVLEHVIWSSFTRYAPGETDFDQIVEVIERTLLRMLGEQPPTRRPPE